MKKYLLEFQKYEIDNILMALRTEIQHEQHDHCEWEFQKDINQFYYTPNKKVKQLEFTIHSILRQYGNHLVEYEKTRV